MSIKISSQIKYTDKSQLFDVVLKIWTSVCLISLT